jgi:hypothetical protein
LSIIGVVAALTIPAVTKNHEKQTWIAQYKTTYSIINQATNMIMADNGGTLAGAYESSATSNLSMFNQYKKYLKYTRTCDNTNITDCFASSYKRLDGDNATGYYQFTGNLVLANGASVSFYAWDGSTTEDSIFIDLNGTKGPNILGKDLHEILVNRSTSTMYPRCKGMIEKNIKDNCPDNLQTTTGWGHSCGVRILRGDYATQY